MKMIKIDVIGMTSDESVSRINGALGDIPGVKIVDMDLKGNAVYVIINDGIDIEHIKNIIKNAGYNPGLHITWIID